MKRLSTYIFLLLSICSIAHADSDCPRLKQCDALVNTQAALIQRLNTQLEKRQQLQGKYDDLLVKHEAERKRYEALLEKYQQALTDSQNLNAQYQQQADQLIILNSQYGQLAKDYDDLAGKYRGIAVDSTPIVSLDLGFGVTSGKHEAVGLVGVGLKKVKLWGLLQKDNNGVIVGASLGL